MSVDFDMSEVTKLAAELAVAPVKANVASSAAMTAIAAALRSEAMSAAPVDTGELRNSISIQGGAGYRIVKATAPHAFFVEFGTGDTSPQPFLWPQAPRALQRLALALEGIDPFD